MSIIINRRRPEKSALTMTKLVITDITLKQCDNECFFNEKAMTGIGFFLINFF